jgi:hypothetical protein
MSKNGRSAPWLIGIAVTICASQGYAQKNIDAERSPAELFSDGCTLCHSSPRALKQGSAEFLRSHYTTGTKQAAAMAAYLEAVRREPPPPKVRRPSPSLEEGKLAVSVVTENEGETETVTSAFEAFEE